MRYALELQIIFGWPFLRPITHDANFNITGILDVGGNAVQRYQYDPYGLRTVLNANFSVLNTPDLYQFDHGYAGGRHDAITGQVHFRNRNYDPVQMRWSSRDPIGFADGYSLFKAYFVVNKLDPSGLYSQEPPHLLIPERQLDGDLPSPIPLDWPRDLIERLIDDSEESIQSREQHMEDLGGGDAGHEERVRREREFQGELEERLEELGRRVCPTQDTFPQPLPISPIIPTPSPPSAPTTPPWWYRIPPFFRALPRVIPSGPWLIPLIDPDGLPSNMT